MVVNWQQVPLDFLIDKAGLAKMPHGGNPGNHRREIINLVCAFDTEASTVYLPNEEGEQDPHSFTYIWQWQIGPDYTVIGRTWEEFNEFKAHIVSCLKAYQEKRMLDDIPYLVSYVHNLGYEFQFFSGIYRFQPEDVFFRNSRKPIYARMDNCVMFRCSYFLSNMSLDKFAKQQGCKTLKRSGDEFDYRIVRYPWTPITGSQLEYCINDVICLQEAITNLLTSNHDTLQSIPLTQTGFVRRDCKKAIKPLRFKIQGMLPKENEFDILRKAFRGGNTHANRDYAGKIYPDVYSFDMVSCYPAQILTQKYPMTAFREMEPPVTMKQISFLIGLGRAVVGTYVFKELRLRDPHNPIPYLSLSKCGTTQTEDFPLLLDNGRILEAYTCETTLTELDLEIVTKQYTFSEVGCLKAITAQKDYLPEAFRNVVLDYYRKKTELKGCEKWSTNKDYDIYMYNRSKERLNSTYGMLAQNACNPELVYYADTNEVIAQTLTPEELDEQLEKAHFPYQWGVYTTAWARYVLQKCIDIMGHDVIYCDTDSVKVIKTHSIDKLNSAIMKLAEKSNAVCYDRTGEPHYIGVFECDAHYDRFVCLGAKRYAYEKHGALGVTVSGVTQSKNPETAIPICAEELGQLENFKEGFIWRKSGGTASVYNDEDDFTWHSPEGDVHITRNLSIIDSTYELGLSLDYALLLANIKTFGEYKKELKR